jgi:hypothetical protein
MRGSKVIAVTSEWSLTASAGPRISRRSQRETERQRRQQVEEICRALVTATTPDGTPVLRRPLTAFERMQLTRRAADLSSAMAPIRGALERITAILAAAPANEVRRASANAVFSGKPKLRSDAPTAPLCKQEA